MGKHRAQGLPGPACCHRAPSSPGEKHTVQRKGWDTLPTLTASSLLAVERSLLLLDVAWLPVPKSKAYAPHPAQPCREPKTTAEQGWAGWNGGWGAIKEMPHMSS